MGLRKLVSVADLFTLVNAILGLTAVLTLALAAASSREPLYDIAIGFILLAFLADGLDGIVARRFSKRWFLGDYLDLMADTISFGVAPGLLWILVAGFALPCSGSVIPLFVPEGLLPALTPLILLLWVLPVIPLLIGTLLRLGRFAHLKGGRSLAFRGLPSPASALTLVLVVALLLHYPQSTALCPGTSSQFLLLIFGLPLLLGALMVSEIPYPKVRGFEAALTAVLLLALIASLWGPMSGQTIRYAIATVFGFHLAYLVGGPILGARRLTDPSDPEAWEAGSPTEGPKRSSAVADDVAEE